MATVAVTYNTLRDIVGLAMGLNADPTAWTVAQADTVNSIIASGLRKFYWPPTPEDKLPHEWSFLRKSATLTLSAGDYDYDLPSDIVSVTGFPVVADYGRIDPVGADVILAMQARRPVSGTPVYWATRARANDSTVGTRYEMLVYPTPREGKTLSYWYVCEPPMIDESNQYPLGGVVHGETIQAAVLASMENIKGDYAGVHTQSFQERLAASIRIDQGQRT